MLKIIDAIENWFHPTVKDRVARWRPVDHLPLTGSTMACLDCGNLSNTENGCRCCGSHALLPIEIVGRRNCNVATAYNRLPWPAGQPLGAERETKTAL